ncbi:SpoIIE family protein phosphatase [Embleya sp. NPDC050154]|uniref:SpoIIE family protein phosphatase n=1 Tax=Embleya sp. NPDC050154 TaxID=3363988 RepID=UPI00379FA772
MSNIPPPREPAAHDAEAPGTAADARADVGEPAAAPFREGGRARAPGSAPSDLTPRANGADHEAAARAPESTPRTPLDTASAVGRLAATVERLRREIQAAHAAADGRALIEMAKGILIERLRCGPTEAARQLATLAEQSGVTRLELAADIVDRTAADRLTEAACDFVTETATPPPGAPRDAGPVSVRLRTAESGACAAGDTQAVAQSLLEHALAPLGATAVAVWAVAPDSSLTLAGSAGFTEHEAARWRHVPPGVVTIARQALADLAWTWTPALSQAQIPSIGQHHLTGARSAAPAGTGGRVHGILEICWPHPLPEQPARVRRQIEALAELCAHTLEAHLAPGDTDTAHAATVDLVEIANCLHDPALVLVPWLDQDGQLVDFRVRHLNGRFLDPAGRPANLIDGALLLEAYPLAATAGGLYDIVERVYATGESYRAESLTLTALVDQVRLDAIADVAVSRHANAILLVWRIERESARLARLLQHAQRLGRIGGFEEDLTTGVITWNESLFALHGLPPTAPPVALTDLPEHAHPDDAAALTRFLRTLVDRRRHATVSFRMERSDGVTRRIRIVAEPVLGTDGRLLAIRGAYQDVSAQHWTEVALAATRDRLAHSEQESGERNRLARQLQHAIMPPTHAPPNVDGLRVAVRYRPAESDTAVGGDWYDTLVLPSDRILLCVGDVAGHGIDAATSMIVLRNALRGLAITGAGPAQLLTWLNTVTHHLTNDVTATAICALYDPSTRIMRWARAGHLPPVCIRDDTAHYLPLLTGPLLGAFAEATYVEGEIRFELDDALLLFTDGLIERRDHSLETSLDQLLITACAPAPTLDDRLDRLLTHSRADTDDDTCVVGIQIT